MSIQAVLLPLFVQVLLTFVLLLRLGVMRRGDVRSGKVHPSQIALREPNWPEPTLQYANSFSNQFELPVLFYVLTILAIVTHQTDLVFVVMAWIFVLCRIGQAFVHTTSNRVTRRGLIYAVGAVVLMIMWGIFAFRILLSGPP